MRIAVIVSGDACFTQKRNKGKGGVDPPLRHPTSVFVPEDVTQKMDDYVETVRPTREPRVKSTKPADKSKNTTNSKRAWVEEVDDEDDEDRFEHEALPVPKSVLDECEASFTAADERRTKSSTKFFDDTGLMALNCRHDHVLFVVNMKTPGERQSNMLALLEMFFSHLPRGFIVGFLYDIACLLERSARKWGFIPAEYLDRLEFAVSVLHAFGHHWVCQMKYHPRRRCLFGFSDGEGCERFWHAISKLIAYLRVCGVSGQQRVMRRIQSLIFCFRSTIVACTRWTRRFIISRPPANSVWERGLRDATLSARTGTGRRPRRWLSAGTR
jgi:hypothetical protein